jgi:hypothetical protein
MGPVWVVPKAGHGGEALPGEGSDLVVADHVGVDADGKLVIVPALTPFWREFIDSGDEQH